jgi:hypothetical protein
MRSASPIVAVWTARLVGLQAQEPRDPYGGVWSRLAGFEVEQLDSLPAERLAAFVHARVDDVRVVPR